MKTTNKKFIQVERVHILCQQHGRVAGFRVDNLPYKAELHICGTCFQYLFQHNAFQAKPVIPTVEDKMKEGEDDA